MIQLSSICFSGIFPAIVPITFTDFKQINIIVGPNGAGKSNLLKLIHSVYLPPNTSCGIIDVNVCDSHPKITPTLEWNKETYHFSIPLKSIRGKLQTSQPNADLPLPENLILEFEKIRPLYSSAERFVDYRCDEMTLFSDDVVNLFQEIVTDYSDKIETAMLQAIKDMCHDLPFHFETEYDWKKAIALKPCYNHLSLSLSEDFPFATISAGQKKHLIIEFTLNRASRDANHPVFIDDFEAFFDKNQIDFFINKMAQMKNQFFITTKSSYVINELMKKGTAIFISNLKYDENRCCQSNIQSYLNDFTI